MIESTINIAAYALAGAAIFILVAIIGIVITMKVVKNLGNKAEDEVESKREERNVIVKNNAVGKPNAKTESKAEKKVEKKLEKKPELIVETTSAKKISSSKELIFIKLGNIQQQERFFLTDSSSLNIGRTKDKNDWIMSEDHTVSQKHCKIYITDGQVYIMDLNSTNGTYVNKQMISHPVKLQNEDILRIGIAEYRLLIRD